MNKNINDVLSRLEFSFLISIIIALTGLWYYFYNQIINIFMPSLVIIHYLITIYLIMTVFLCFIKGLFIVKNDNNKYNNKFQHSLVKIYFYSWLPTIIISIILFCTSIFSLDISFQLCLLIVFIIICGFLYYKRKDMAKLWKSYLMATLILIPSFFVFVFGLSIISMSVEIETDKKIYNKGENIYVNLETKGYTFHPVICNLTGGCEIYTNYKSTIKCSPDGKTWMIPTNEIYLSGITLAYRHPKLSQVQTKFYRIHIKP